jgi:catechol 2,3-dioxygenase-like lactoylglutathione lyase family enzyme
MAVNVEGLAFAGIATADPAAAARFFADVLGVEVEVSGEVRRLSLPDGSSLALVPQDYVSPPSDTIVGFLVDDVEAATAELAANGIEPDGELNAGYGFRYRHFRAPDGRRFELLDRRT